MKFILTQYEEGMRGNVQIDDVQYEHIMPQTPTDYWRGLAGTGDPNEYARLVNNIGNIVPLDPHTNIAGSNDDWPTKSQLYENEVPNWLAAGIARSHEGAWTPADIGARAGEIAEWSVSVRWNLDNALSQLPTD